MEVEGSISIFVTICGRNQYHKRLLRPEMSTILGQDSKPTGSHSV